MADPADTAPPAVPQWAVAAPTSTAASDVPRPDDAAPDGTAPDGTAPNGTAPNGTAPVEEPDDAAHHDASARATSGLDLAPGPDPRWARPAFAVLLVVTAVVWLWDVGRNGWGNTFYAAAVQAGTQSWKAFFFGSFDAGNFITVDKPPVSLWVMALSGRLFGFSSWSMLAPNVLLGVGTVALLHATVKRAWGAPAGLLAGAALAVTPVAALMFRFNNPDAALTFLLVLGAWTTTRAVEDGRWHWGLLTGLVVGTAFLTKSLQALLVLPGFAVAHLVAAPGTLGRRAVRLLASGGVAVVAGLWWMLVVVAVPAPQRPYAGGSTDDSPLSLALGFNGIGRLTGDEGGGPGGGAGRPGGGFGGGPGAGFGGTPGVGRMFNSLFGGEVAWLLPAALVMLVVGLWLTRRAPRTDVRRASLLLWGGWLLVTAGVFSFMNGIVHTYYTVALAPAVAALAGMLLPALWRNRSALVARAALGVAMMLTTVTAFVLLGRAGDWYPWLRWVVAGLAVGALLAVATGARGRRVGAAVAGLAVVSAVAAPTAWSLQTVRSTHVGSIPTSGPAVGGQAFGPGGAGRFDRDRFGAQDRQGGRDGGQGGDQGFAPPQGGFGPPGQQGGFGPPGQQGGSTPPQGGPRGGAPGAGVQVDAALVALLRQDADRYTWVAAASSSMLAGPLQLQSGRPVMSLGGFGGQDPAITLDGFRALVAAKKVHWYVAGAGGFGGPGGGPGGREGGATAQIAQWVTSSFTARTVGGVTVYDLTQPATG